MLHFGKRGLKALTPDEVLPPETTTVCTQALTTTTEATENLHKEVIVDVQL